MWIVTLILKYLPGVTRLAPALSFVRDKGRWLVLAVIAGMGAWIWWQGHRIDGLERDLDQKSTDLAACASANESNQDAINELHQANESLASALTASQAGAEEIAKNLRRKEVAAEKQLSRALSELEELKHENPSCEELASLDVGAVCPSVVERLREHAKDSRSN